MSWTTPKTDWNGTEYFGSGDWIRITENLSILATAYSVSFTPHSAVTPFVTALTSADRNNITNTLEKVLNKAYASWNRGYVAPRIDFGSAWNSTDLNIIEDMMLNLKKQLDGEISGNDFYRCGEEVCCGETMSVGLL